MKQNKHLINISKWKTRYSRERARAPALPWAARESCQQSHGQIFFNQRSEHLHGYIKDQVGNILERLYLHLKKTCTYIYTIVFEIV